MTRFTFPIALLTAAIFAACSTPETDMSDSALPAGPVAKKVPFEMTEHGDTRVDDYFWMRLSDDQKNAETPDEQTQEVLDLSLIHI